MSRRFLLLCTALPLLATGCSVVDVKVAKTTPASLRRDAIQATTQSASSPASAALARAQAKKLAEAERAAALLDAAQPTTQAKPGSSEHAINIAATRGLLALMAARHFAPLNLPDGRILGVSADSKRTLDPRTAETIIPAADIRISKMRNRVVQEGLGLPCVVRFEPDSPALRKEAGVPPLGGICEAATVLVRTDAKNPTLVFYRTATDDDAVVDGRRLKLAADFTAPLAYMLSKGRNRNIDINALLRVDRHIGRTGLYQLSRHDPEKIPVVFVHGLLSRPETWAPALNGMMADEKIRERYQFWFFMYPTGLPVWSSAAELRSELDRYRSVLDPARGNRRFDRMVLAGHSMGGLISSLQIRSGGAAFWKQFMDTPPQQLALSPKYKDRIVRIVQFQPRPEVARAVFFATPHRGSYMAVNPFTEFFSRLIRLPADFIDAERQKLQSILREDVRGIFVAPANSLVFLRANSPLLQSILNLPLKKGIPHHSVVGDRGKGDAPNSSDGVVPYWSSRLDSVESEKIVPSGHGAHEHPEGIAELARILHLHLAESR